MDGIMGPAQCNFCMRASAASDNATNVEAKSTTVKNIIGYNAKASIIYVKLYQKATAPTSADTPKAVYAIPASGPFELDLGDGLFFSGGLGLRIVTGSADNDATAIAANDVVGLNISYRC